MQIDVTGSMRRRLAEAGIRCGAEVEVLNRTAGGGRLIAVAGSRMAIGTELAQSIQVRAHV